MIMIAVLLTIFIMIIRVASKHEVQISILAYVQLI